MTLRDYAIRYGFIVLLVGLIAYFAITADGFVSPQSAVFIFQSVAITGVLALGVTATLVVGGFDLSIGSVATSAMMAASYAMVVLEQNANFGVVFPWWDRLFGTYRPEPAAGQDKMAFGLMEIGRESDLGLFAMLALPFRK